MRTTTYTKRLAHDRYAISSFLADLRNDPEWRREVVESTLRSGEPGRAGAEYLETVAAQGVQVQLPLVVTDVVPGARLVVEARDLTYTSRYEYQFLPVDGGTEITVFMSIEMVSGLKLAEPIIWPQITRWVERDLAMLDEAIDNGKVPAHPDDTASVTDIYDAHGEASRAFLGEVVDSLSEGVLLANTEGRAFYANRAAEKTLGIPREAILGRRIDDPAFTFTTLDGRRIPPEEVPLARVLRTGQSVLGSVYRIALEGEKQVTVSENVVPLVVDDITAGAAITFSDITERAEAQTQVRFQSRLLEEVRNAVLASDPAGRVVFVNDEAVALFGRSRQELLGGGVMELLHPRAADAGQAVMAEVMAGGRWEGEACFEQPDGTEVPVLLSLGLLTNEREEPDGFVSVAHDISDIKAAEKALEEKDRAIRQAYVDVIGAVTGGRLVLLTRDELRDTLGTPLTEELPLVACDLASCRHDVIDVMAEEGVAADPSTAVVAIGEAATNALKHAGGGTYQVFGRDGMLQVDVADDGPGIDFTNLPKATLLAGYSSTQTLGMGYTIMLDLADRVLLATEPGHTEVVLEFARA